MSFSAQAAKTGCELRCNRGRCRKGCKARRISGVARVRQSGRNRRAEQRLQQAADEGSAGKRLTDLVDAKDFPHVHVDHALHVALERMGTSQLDLLPVVSRANVHQWRGVVTLADALAQFGVKGRK